MDREIVEATMNLSRASERVERLREELNELGDYV